MKWVLRILGILVVVGLFIFFFAAGKVVDRQKNIRELDKLPPVSAAAQQLHQRLIIADLHSDNLLWDRNILKRHNHGHVDIPRLLEGNFSLQIFDAVIKTPRGQNYDRNDSNSDNITLLAMSNRWPRRTWNSLLERAIYQSKILHKAEINSDGKLKIVRSKTELQNFLQARTTNKNQVAGLLSIEGLHALEGKVENLDPIYDAGYRMLGLTHFFDNKLAGSSSGIEQGGLTDFGRAVLRKMEEKGFILDLAHLSSKGIKEVLERSDIPVVVSHTGLQMANNITRNLSDDEVRAIAARGGLIGIGYWKGAVGSSNPSDIARCMRYVGDLVGIEHVALGSDWDGGVTTRFDASQIVVLTDALLQAGFDETEILKIMGGNQIRFLLEHLPKE